MDNPTAKSRVPGTRMEVRNLFLTMRFVPFKSLPAVLALLSEIKPGLRRKLKSLNLVLDIKHIHNTGTAIFSTAAAHGYRC